MPIHDWKRAPTGYFHHFHQRWTGAICDALNAGLLPKGVFALVEPHAGAVVPDVLALESRMPLDVPRTAAGSGSSLATETPKTRLIVRESEEVIYAAKADRVAVHREDETIAVIEIVSPGNKSSVSALREFVDKSLDLLERGIHLQIVDLFPPTARDPQGMHDAIWSQLSNEPFELPPDKPLTLVSYCASAGKTAYVEPVAVGDALPDMPVFVETKAYVRVHLEPTYQSTWNLCPEEFRQRVLARAEGR